MLILPLYSWASPPYVTEGYIGNLHPVFLFDCINYHTTNRTNVQLILEEK